MYIINNKNVISYNKKKSVVKNSINKITYSV